MPPPHKGEPHKWEPLSIRPSVCCMPWPNSRMERPRQPKIGRMEAHHTSNLWTYLEVKRSRSPGRLMLSEKVCHIVQMGRPTNFERSVQMEHKNQYHRQAPRCDLQGQRSRSRRHVVRLRGVGAQNVNDTVLRMCSITASTYVNGLYLSDELH